MPARPPVALCPPSPGTPSEKEICQYIAEMCGELRRLASHSKFRTVGYLLDMARLESERMAKDLPG